MFLLTEVLPANKIVRISGLSGRTELNGRIGILLLNLDARPGRAPISLVPTEAAPGEWVHAKLTHLRPAPMEEDRRDMPEPLQCPGRHGGCAVGAQASFVVLAIRDMAVELGSAP